MLPTKGKHIAIGNTCETREKKQIASRLQCRFMSVESQSPQLLQRYLIQCTRASVLASLYFDRIEQQAVDKPLLICQAENLLGKQSDSSVTALRQPQHALDIMC